MPRGWIDDMPTQEFSNEVFKLVAKVKEWIEKLLASYAERELTTITAKIFFISGRLFIGLVLARYKIELDYEFIINSTLNKNRWTY